MSELILITPTGGRVEGMELLAQYLDAQTYKGPATFLVVDDCDPATPLPDSRFAVEVLRPSWRWQKGDNTQCQSMALALDQVGDNDTVLIIEDDDAYLQNHIEATLHELETVELVGEKVARYYNVYTRRHQTMSQSNHATLASTGMRGNALKLLREICDRPTRSIDINLWHEFHGPKSLTENANVVGIKGLPGRGGIGIGHKAGFGQPDMTNTLRQWLGARSENYTKFGDR